MGKDLGIEWIRERRGAGVIVFVHGVLSNCKDCFTDSSSGTYWPDLLSLEDKHKEIGIAVFNFGTGPFAGVFNLSDIVAQFKTHIDHNEILSGQPWAVFVCHSLGGLVARKYIVSYEVELAEIKIPIGLFLVASPAGGSIWANILSLISFIVPNAQRDVLKIVREGSILQDLNLSFVRVKQNERFPILGVELCETRFFGGPLGVLLPRVVSTNSGGKFFAYYKIPFTDHCSISKPKNSKVFQHIKLLGFLKDVKKCALKQQAQTYVVMRPENPVGEEPDRPVNAVVEGELAAEYVRTNLLTQLEKGNGLQVIVGPTGSGKTTLLRSYASRLQRNTYTWIDCRLELTRPQCIENAELIIVDGLTATHPLIREHWFSFNNRRIIVATHDSALAEECLMRGGMGGNDEQILTCNFFSLQETTNWLRSCCTDLDDTGCEAVFKLTGGDPVALQLSREALRGAETAEDVFSLVPAGNHDEFLAAAMVFWLQSEQSHELLRDLLYCLAAVPFAGMTGKTLASLLSTPEDEVMEQLNYLRRKGFVAASKASHTEAPVFIIAGAIRNLIQKNASIYEGGRVQSWRRKYLDCLMTPEVSSLALVDLLDAWLVSWDTVFSAGRTTKELDWLFKGHEKHLKNIAMRAGGQQFVERNLSEILRRRSENLSRLGCQIVIAYSVHLFKKTKSSLSAGEIWPGAYSKDCWARATSISCAFFHWTGTEAGRGVAISHIRKWLDHYLSRALQEREKRNDEREWGWMPDFDLCAAASCLAAAKAQHHMTRFLRSSDFRSVHSCLTTAHVALLAGMAERESNGDEIDFAFAVECLRLPRSSQSDVPSAMLWYLQMAFANSGKATFLSQLANEKPSSNQCAAMLAKGIAYTIDSNILGRWLSEKHPDVLRLF